MKSEVRGLTLCFCKKSKKGSPYPQTREWRYNGNEIKTTDWTDHGKPLVHENPHDHPFLKNATGGTLERGKPEPFRVTDEKTIMETR